MDLISRMFINYLSLDFCFVVLNDVSQPPAILTWYVNDELPEGRFVKNYHFPKRADGLEQVSAQLQFYSERAHYRNGLLKLRCISNIIQGYSVTSDEVVITDSQKYATPPGKTIVIC